MIRVIFASLLILALGVLSPAFAQECPVFSSSVRNAKDAIYIRSLFLRASTKIDRLNELAIMANELNAIPGSQRAALDAEFQIWVRYLTWLGEQKHPLSAKSVQFIDTVLDSTFLGISGAGVDGPTVAEAEARSYDAVRKTVGALSKLWRCYAGPVRYSGPIVTTPLIVE
jgi:hypothetical protein